MEMMLKDIFFQIKTGVSRTSPELPIKLDIIKTDLPTDRVNSYHCCSGFDCENAPEVTPS